MSDREDKDNLISNPETRRRRDWVDRAVAGARRRIEGEQGIPPADEPLRRPRLYVVRSGRPR
jgi:hypothetical protein